MSARERRACWRTRDGVCVRFVVVRVPRDGLAQLTLGVRHPRTVEHGWVKQAAAVAAVRTYGRSSSDIEDSVAVVPARFALRSRTRSSTRTTHGRQVPVKEREGDPEQEEKGGDASNRPCPFSVVAA